jgi:hypothetical protein
VAEGEDKVIEGWLVYGLALNLGRGLFPEGANVRFSRWVSDCTLQGEVSDYDRAAANLSTFHLLRRKHCKVRTVRGLHAKWNEANRPQPKLEKR